MRLELLVFCGLQGAGKTTYYRKRYLTTHAYVSKDALPSARDKDKRQGALIEEALRRGRSVVVDNTNATPECRAPLVALAKRHGARAVALYFEAAVRPCLARNASRSGRGRVPDVAIFATAKRLVPPSLDEGFDEVRRHVDPALSR
ncbi:MAG: ATP-binding protein [Elusimicrobia bacterium]|nr:ATP-binding protein [Elusimicrobiota bacterium]